MRTDPLFRYRVEECDVSDRETLKLFREHLERWDDLLNRDATHSIAAQMSDLLWQDAAWRSTNEARRFAKEDGANAAIAPLLAELLDRGYVSGQVISISRLIEPSDPKHPRKAVVSLRRIVDEMRRAQALFTRENFVAQDALPYDWEPVRDAMMASAGKNGVVFSYGETTGPKAWNMAELQHKLFDAIAGVAAEKRARGDVAGAAFFDKLDAKLTDPLLEDIRTMRNKTIAHAADAHSRGLANNLRKGLTLEEFAKAHYLLSGIFQAVSVVLFGQWRGAGVPVPQDDQFANLDLPFISQKRKSDLSSFWSTHCRDRDNVLHDAYRDIIPKRT